MKNPIVGVPSPFVPNRGARLVPSALALCGALGFLLAGCSSEPDSHLVSAPPPAAPMRAETTTTVMTTPAAVNTPVIVANPGYPAYVANSNTTPVVSTTVVTQAPPAMQTDAVVSQPNPQDVWLAGYWSWRNEQYEWVAGHWEMPPGPSSVWVAPRWEQEGNAYRFHEGYWN
jgi:hypothetical protein